jgi:ADP-heptose:LPS heptosyltransferase
MTKEKILVIKTGAVGDTILFLPALEAIRQKFHDHFIEIMGHEERLSFLQGSDYADSIASIESKDLFSLFIEDADPSEDLLTYLNTFRHIFSFLKEEKVFLDNMKKFYRGDFISIPPFPKAGEKVHAVDYLLLSLQEKGIEPAGSVPHLSVTEQIKEEALAFLKEHSLDPDVRKIAAIHPGSGSREKNRPLSDFSTIGRDIQKKYDAEILLLIGPAEETMEEEMRNAVKGLNPFVAKNLPLRLLSGVLMHCFLYAGNDSGITHLAAAVGIPTVALFRSTDPHVWGPRGENVKIIGSVEEWNGPDSVGDV